VEAYTAMLAMDPRYVPAYNGLGLICGVLQKYAQGCTLFRRGLALDPDNAALHYNYGRLLAAQGRFEHARAEYQAALRCRPDWYKPASQLGTLLCRQGQYAHALELLSANLKFNPRNPEIRDTIKQVLAAQEAARQTLKNREKEPAVPAIEPMGDMEVPLSDMADMLKYLARLAEYLPAAEREHFMNSDIPSAMYHIMGLISKSSGELPGR
jgi:Tfp pilus assembly protein PilF